MSSPSWIGRSLPRREDFRLLTGRGTFVDDLQVEGCLVAFFVRSSHGSARILSVDDTTARDMPGVVGVWSAGDLGPLNRPMTPSVPPNTIGEVETPRPLADGVVRHVGEPVAVVLAENRYLAEDAADFVRVRYEPLSAVADLAHAAETGSPRVHPHRSDNIGSRNRQIVGDPDAAFARAPATLHVDLTIHRGAAQPMETRGVLAKPSEDGQALTHWTSHQRPHRVREVLADMLQIPLSSIRVISPDVGGGFGVKGNVYPEDVVVAWLALTLRRPVKWTEDRREHFQASLHERDQMHQVEVAFDRNGRILALRNRFDHDCGAYMPYRTAVQDITLSHFPGPYAIENLDLEGRCVYTNAVPTGPYRGAGRPQACFVMERVIDHVARACGLDPLTVRRRNLIRPEQMPYPTGVHFRGQPVIYDGGNFVEALRLAEERIDVPAFRKYQEAARAQGRYPGLGLVVYTESSGSGPFEGARVRLLDDGRIRVDTGATPQGQGHHTTFALICAEGLGVDPDQIEIVTGDTAGIDRGIGTYASRSTVTAGSAVTLAAKQFKERALQAASTLLEAQLHDLETTSQGVSVKGAPGRRISWRELAQAAQEIDPPLDVTVYFEPENQTWPVGALALTLEVDVDTGSISLNRAVFVHDCGTLVNPRLVEGQVVGGLIQGLADSLWERVEYGEDGQLRNASFMDYLLPTTVEAPVVEILHLHTPSPLNPHGFKGAGESGVIPAGAAVAQAIEDALAPFGVEVRKLPLFPEEIRRLID